MAPTKTKTPKLVLPTAVLSDDVLEKAIKAPHKVSYGHWNGLPIIAIGPLGGKIVGYKHGNEPIYAGSVGAQKLAEVHAAKFEKNETHEQHHHTKHWLVDHLHIPVTEAVSSGGFYVHPSAAQALHDAFGVPSEHGPSGLRLVKVSALWPHVGHALKPAAHEDLDYGAAMAAGDDSNPAFPQDISAMKEIPAGKFAGSHGNRLFQAADGRRYLFKAANPAIARAEEAASRLGRLVLGPGKVQDAKYVKLSGKGGQEAQEGVLIRVVDDATPLGPEHKTIAPKTETMQEHFADIVGQNVLDWLVSNHDAHGDNFMVTKDGVTGIDKGQAWKFIGSDELSMDYSPNASTQVYNFFWKQVKEGKIKGDPMPVLKKVFANIAKISDEQFKAIVAPYVTLRAGKDGVPASTVEKKLVDRFHESKANWKWFLGKVYPHHQDVVGVGTQKHVPIVLDAAVAPAPAEVTPVAPAQKLTVPVKKTPLVAEPKAAPAGWPLKKGTVTVHHPGAQAPAGWPGGYPGPGYKAEIDYKGQKVHFEFMVLNGSIVVNVTYPDGKQASFDSPNKASDSVFLWAKGLPLDMNAAEKKKAGISYSATKLLKLKEFENELKEHGPTTTPGSMSVEQLEAEKIVTPEVKEFTAYDALKAHGSGVCIDKSLLPVPIQDFTSVHKTDAMIEKIGDKITVWSSYYGNDGSPKYISWAVTPEGKLGALNVLDHAPDPMKGTTLELKPKTVVGPAPAAVKAPEVKAKIEEPAVKPAFTPGPLAEGTKITIKKKGIDSPVTLIVNPDNTFAVTVWNKAKNDFDTMKPFKSLSAASDHVWVVSQGYADVEDYKAKTGKQKIASGGGWKFWGVKPGEEPKPSAGPSAPSPAPAPAQAPKTTKLSAEQAKKLFEDHSGVHYDSKAEGSDPAWWQSWPEGTKIAWVENDNTVQGLVEATKGPNGLWSIKYPGDDNLGNGSDKGMAVNQTENMLGKLSVISSEPQKTVMKQLGGDGWTVHGKSEYDNLNFWLKLPQGTKVSWNTSIGAVDAELVPGGPSPWKVTTPSGEVLWEPYGTVQMMAESATDAEIAVQKPTEPEQPAEKTTPSDPNWETMPPPQETSWWANKPAGFTVKFTDSLGDSVKAVKMASGKWLVNGLTKYSPSEISSIALEASSIQAQKEAPAAPAAPAVATKKTIHQTIASQVPASSKVPDIEKMSTLWSKTKTTDGSHYLGEKPSGWDAWVPPPGTWIEGEIPAGYTGPGTPAKKLWFTTAISGYSEDGDTAQMVNFAIVDETGKLTYQSNPAPAEKAGELLQDLLEKHTSGTAIGWKVAFKGAQDNHFPVGATKESLDYGAHASDHAQESAPPAAAVIPKATNPEDLKGPAASQPVTATIGLLDAWKDLDEVKKYGAKKLKLKPATHNPAQYWMCLDNVPGLSPEDHVKALQDLCDKLGVKPVSGPKNNSFGALVTLSTADVMAAKVPVVVPAAEVPAIELAAPEVAPLETTQTIDLKNHPKKIFASWKESQKFEALKALPIGTHLTLGNGAVYKKVGDTWPQWEGVEPAMGKFTHSDIASKTKAHKGAIVSAGPAQLPIPKAKPEPAEKPLPKWTPPPADPAAEAKKAWAKLHPALGAEHMTQVAWLLKKSGMDGAEIFARQTPQGSVLIGDGTAEFGSKLKGVDFVKVDSPHGPLFAIPKAQLEKATPEATTIKGPDGAEYPYGTTFETSKVYKTLEELLPNEQGFTKFSEYKGPDPSQFQKTVKIAGNSVAHKVMAEAIVKKYGLATPIIQGSGNTMFFVSDAALKAHAGEPETKVVPKLPAQPQPLKTKGVGVALGVPNEGHAAPINRDDLGAIDQIIPFRHGYSIRFGAGGVLFDGQLLLHRVKLPDGKIVNRLVGELTKDLPVLDPKKQFGFWSASAKNKHQLFPDWKEHDFDPATGIHEQTAQTTWTSGGSYSSGADLGNGVSLYTFASKQKSYGGQETTVYKNGTHRRTFVLDVPVGQDAESAMAQAMAKLGVNVAEAMAQPNEDDERIMKKIQILRSQIGAQGWRQIAQMDLLSKPKAEREAVIDAALKGKIAKKYIDSARVVIGHDGMHHVELDDLDDGIGTKVKGVATHISIEGIANVFIQGGYGGQGQCLFTGNSRNIDGGSGATTSGEADMMGGGGVGKYFRTISDKVDSHSGSSASKPMLVAHPRILKKTNWYAADGDTFGKQEPDSDQRTRRGVLNLSSSSNEVMVENLSPKDIAGAVVGSEQARTKLIGYFKKLGMSEINGCPVEQFVVVGNVHYGLNESISKLPLLKKG